MIFIIWGLLVLLNIAWAAINADITLKGEKTYHGWTALGYIIIIVGILLYTFEGDSLVSYICPFLSLLFLHLSVFPVLYNLFREVPPFYLSKTTTAITDRLMVKVGLKNTSVVNIGSFILSIILLCL